ncbi:MAG TPA: TetR/AcrR family transcriptional regulator [Alphaproteobacteria bacterium]|jgi:AcrR family transcriptional regulator|nr:TetR/AcrR family transcriptional regulator [Alphaproteobacteria bacterium]
MAVGRPRAFDREEALDKALEVFWRQGYEATSIAELTKAMGINPPSLYAAFGNKEALFRQALDRYVEKGSVRIREAMAQPTARAAVEKLLRDGADRLTDPTCPHSCMLVTGALACSEEAEEVRDEVASRRAMLETALRERFERARAEGDLSDNTDPASLARYVATIAHGMSVQVAGGATRKDLLDIVEVALKAFPA